MTHKSTVAPYQMPFAILGRREYVPGTYGDENRLFKFHICGNTLIKGSTGLHAFTATPVSLFSSWMIPTSNFDRLNFATARGHDPPQSEAAFDHRLGEGFVSRRLEYEQPLSRCILFVSWQVERNVTGGVRHGQHGHILDGHPSRHLHSRPCHFATDTILVLNSTLNPARATRPRIRFAQLAESCLVHIPILTHMSAAEDTHFSVKRASRKFPGIQIDDAGCGGRKSAGQFAADERVRLSDAVVLDHFNLWFAFPSSAACLRERFSSSIRMQA
ncbi:hypothetical protein GQ44DRAFT_755929 [Phaeosphaeriaceae sp. PMI808]|nr:hypothetical protein GQ44DRAFT_755929 [Phaeosphaeriaceae sp. PMI808]